VTTIMVFVMVFIASIFFLVADQVMRIAVSYLLGINSG
jgi:preprotein translocase subunit SecE